MRLRELAHERRKANLAEPPSPPKALRSVRRKISSIGAKKGVFQHNQLYADISYVLHEQLVWDEPTFAVRRMSSHNAEILLKKSVFWSD